MLRMHDRSMPLLRVIEDNVGQKEWNEYLAMKELCTAKGIREGLVELVFVLAGEVCTGRPIGHYVGERVCYAETEFRE